MRISENQEEEMRKKPCSPMKSRVEGRKRKKKKEKKRK